MQLLAYGRPLDELSTSGACANSSAWKGTAEHADAEADVDHTADAEKKAAKTRRRKAAKLDKNRRRNAPIAARQMPTDNCTTMAEVMECTRIITEQRGIAMQAIMHYGPTRGVEPPCILALRKTIADLDFELEAVRLDAQNIVAELRGKA